MIRRPSCRLPVGEPCRTMGQRGVCGDCHDLTAASARMKAVHSKWADCPDHLWAEYRELQKRGLTADEVRRALEHHA